MADNKKYYYLKLKENFFDSDSMVLLESMQDGILYSNILMKMYLKSLRNDGYLVLNITTLACRSPGYLNSLRAEKRQSKQDCRRIQLKTFKECLKWQKAAAS